MRRQRGQRRARYVDFIAEYPGMSRVDAPVLGALQAQLGHSAGIGMHFRSGGSGQWRLLNSSFFLSLIRAPIIADGPVYP